MVLIRDTKGRGEEETESGYVRVTGNKPLGQLISKYHATSIRAGNELEVMLEERLQGRKDVAIRDLNKDKRIFKGLKTDSSGKKHDIKIDVVILEIGDNIMLIELKDGDTFDTKKSAGEMESLKLVRDYLTKQGKKVEIKFCSFYAENHEQIERGAKGLLEKGMSMTGREFCDLLKLDFDEIVNTRKKDQQENLKYFTSELKKIS
jgi:hypothetical protein